MSVSAKKIAAFAVSLLVVAALGAYFFFIPSQEKKYEQEIAAFIEALPGNLAADTIRVNFLGNAAEIRGLRGATQLLGSDMRVDVASLTLAGLNFTLGKRAGADKLADSLSISGCSITKESAMMQEITFKHLELHNIRGDFNAAVADLFGDALLERKMDIAATFSAGPLRLKEYVNTVNTPLGQIMMSLASWEAQEASLSACKNAVWEKMSLAAFGKEIIGLDRMSVAFMKMPNIFAPLLDFVEMRRDFDDASAIILEKMRREPFEMRGVVMEGCRFQFMKPAPITADKISVDLDASADRLAFTKDVQGLILLPAIYGPMSLEAALFSAFYGKPLDMDLRMDVLLTQKPGAPVEILFRDLFIRDKNLASVRLRGIFTHKGDARHVYDVFGDRGDILLKNATVTLEDKAIVSTFLEAEFGGGSRASAGESRERAARSILALCSAAGEGYAALGEGLASLIRAPGRLTIVSAPEVPVNVTNPGRDILKALRLTLEYSPAN